MTPSTRKHRQAARADQQRSLADWKLNREAEAPWTKPKKGTPGGQQKKRGYRPPDMAKRVRAQFGRRSKQT